MTDEQKVSAIKRINERKAQIKRDFGEDSSLYRQYSDVVYLAIPDDALLPSGNISHSKAAVDLIDDDMLETLLRRETAGDIKRHAKEEARRESEETGETVTWQEIIEAQEVVYETMEDNYDDFYSAVRLYWEKIGKGHPKPTYTTIKELIDANNAEERARSAGYVDAANDIKRNVENKLTKRLEAQDTQERYFT